MMLLMDKILHDPKDPKLWELWYIPYSGYCRILSISSNEIFATLTTTSCELCIGLVSCSGVFCTSDGPVIALG